MTDIGKREVAQLFARHNGSVDIETAKEEMVEQYDIDENVVRMTLLTHTNQDFNSDPTMLTPDDNLPTADEFEEDAQGRGVDTVGDNGEDLTEISGVGHSVEKRLKEAGFRTKYDIASADDEELEAVDGLGVTTIDKINQDLDAADLESEDEDEGEEEYSWDREGYSSYDATVVDEPTGDLKGDESFYHLPVREDIDHPMIPDVDFIAQESRDGVSNVEEFAFKMADNDFGLILTGEPGTGKGRLVRYAASKVNAPVPRVNLGARVTKDKLVGGFVPKNGGEEKVQEEFEQAKAYADQRDDLCLESALEYLGVREKFEWQDGLLTLAARNGWWFLADEINGASAENLFPFFGLLEDDGSRTLELTERSEVIEPHPGFRFVCTRNPTSKEGAKRMNNALLDRMYEMEVDYLPPRKEVDLVKSRTNLSEQQASDLVDLANNIRAAYDKGEIRSKTVTPRMLFRIGRMANDLFSLEAAAKDELISLEVREYEDHDAVERRIEQNLGN